MGLLDRLGYDGYPFDIVEAPMVRNAIGGPGLQDHLQALDETIAVLGDRNAEALEVAGNRAPADTELDAAVADHVERRDLLGDAQRMRQWQEHTREPEAKGRGPLGQRREHQ